MICFLLMFSYFLLFTLCSLLFTRLAYTSLRYRRMDGGVSSFIYHTLRTHGGRSVNPYFRGLNDTARNRAFYPSAFQTKVRWEAPKQVVTPAPKQAIKPTPTPSSPPSTSRIAGTSSPLNTLTTANPPRSSSISAKNTSKQVSIAESDNKGKVKKNKNEKGSENENDDESEDGTDVHKLFQILKKKAREQTIRDIAEAIAGTMVREEQENERENFHSVVENAEGWNNTQDILDQVRQVLLVRNIICKAEYKCG